MKPVRFALLAEIYLGGMGGRVHKILASAFVILVFTGIVHELRAASDQMGEPFGLDEFVAPENSSTWQQWKKIMAEAEAEVRKVQRCSREEGHCNAGELRFLAMVRETKEKVGRAKIEFANVAVNGAIHYQSDQAHWGVSDVWSLPVDTSNEGSFNTGVGDCEDFVLAKYGILNYGGVPDADLRVLLVHDYAVREDHAVLAVRHEQQWIILDNRWNNLFKDKDKELRQFKPVMSVERKGVWVLSKSFRISDAIAPSSGTTAPSSGTTNALSLLHRLMFMSVR